MALVGSCEVSSGTIWIVGVNESIGVQESDGAGVGASQVSS